MEEKALRPIDLARIVGLRPTQIRTYERVGFLPPAGRSPAGYRRYTASHVDALCVARCLITGYGWLPALAVMQAVHAGDRSRALALVDTAHAALARERTQVEQATQVIQRAWPESPRLRARSMRIGAAAEAVGVNPSAIRFWEQHELLRPDREPSTGFRVYDQQQMRRLHVLVQLRAAGYRFDAIRSVVDDLAADRPGQARHALDRRRAAIEQASMHAMKATAELHSYLLRVAALIG